MSDFDAEAAVQNDKSVLARMDTESDEMIDDAPSTMLGDNDAAMRNDAAAGSVAGVAPGSGIAEPERVERERQGAGPAKRERPEAGDGSSSCSEEEDNESSDSENDGSEESDDDGDDDFDDEDDGLSEYERLRLRNIRRNEARLAELGLLSKAAARSSSASGGGAGGAGAAGGILGRFLGSADGGESKQSKKKKKPASKAPVPRRSLPPRRSKRKRSSMDPGVASDAPKKKRGPSPGPRAPSTRSPAPSVRSRFEVVEYDSDESSHASPVRVRRTLRPQPHQAALDEGHLKHYLKTRRSRRGRPKREEYVYACDEVCRECGGEWRFNDAGGGCSQGEVEGIDTDDLDELEERTRLIRCKDCRGAFHLGCMLIHGKKDARQGEDGGKSAVVVVTAAAEEDGKLAASSAVEEGGKAAAIDSSGSAALVSSGSTDEEDGKPDVSFESTGEGDRIPYAIDSSDSTKDKEDGKEWKEGEEERGEGQQSSALSSENSTESMVAEAEVDATARAKEKDDRKPATFSAESVDEMLQSLTRDPKRCYLCELKRRSQQNQQEEPEQNHQKEPAPMSPLPLLEASIGERTVHVRVTPEPKLEASVNGREVTCYVTIQGTASCDEKGSPRKRVTWGSPLEDLAKEDAATARLRKLIAKALARGDHAQLQDHSCAALRRLVFAADDEPHAAVGAARLGGVRMLANAMRRHPERPVLQAEALCTLSEIVWLCPHLGIETIDNDEDDGGSCLDLAIAAMERHTVHAKVQQMGCGYFRAVSYDAKCCARLKKSSAVATVADSIRRNPRKVDVVMEGR